MKKPGKPRPIIAKFLYRPDRRDVIMNKRKLTNGVFASEDLIKEDLDKKKQYKDIMKDAYLKGSKPRFHNGHLYIDGKLYQD